MDRVYPKFNFEDVTPVQQTGAVNIQQPQTEKWYKGGFLQGLIDTLRVAEYAVGGAWREAGQADPQKTENMFLPWVYLKGAVKGVKEKYGADQATIQAVRETLGDKIANRPEVKGIAFGMSIFLDPLTYVGISGPAKALTKTTIGRIPKVQEAAKLFSEGMKNSVVKNALLEESAWKKGTFYLGEWFGEGKKKFVSPLKWVSEKAYSRYRKLFRTSSARIEEIINGTADEFGKLTTAQRELYVDAMNRGMKGETVRNGSETIKGIIEVNDPIVKKLVNENRQAMNYFFDEMVEQGFISKEAQKSFYFPHYFEKYFKKNTFMEEPLRNPKSMDMFKARGKKLIEYYDDLLKQGKLTKAEHAKFVKIANEQGVDGWMRDAGVVMARHRIQMEKTRQLAGFINDFRKIGIREGWIKKLEKVSEKEWQDASKGFSKLKKFGEDIAIADDIAAEMSYFIKGEPIGHLERTLRSVQNFWKQTATSGVIVPNFGFHARNATTNMWQNLLGGVFNPADYWRALKSQITKNDLYKLANKEGILGKGFQNDSAFNTLMRGGNNKFRELLTKIFHYPRQFGNFIEDNAKLAHFSNKLKNGLSVDDAIKSTEKFLFDYTDITK